MAVAWLGFHWTHIIAIAVVVAIVVVAISILDLATDMHMPSLASRSKTPAPPRSILSLINPLKLDIPTKSKRVSKTSQPTGGKRAKTRTITRAHRPLKTPPRNNPLNIPPPHPTLALRAQYVRREGPPARRLDLRLDPRFQAALAGVYQVLAFRGWVAVGELRGDAAREAGVAFVALGLGFAAFGWGGRFSLFFFWKWVDG